MKWTDAGPRFLIYDGCVAYDICSRNGKIIPASEAQLSVFNIEFAYGFGVYENVRVVGGTPRHALEHIERLQMSARAIGLEHEFQEQLIIQWISELIREVNADALNLKILLIGAREPQDAMLFILPLAPLFPEKKLYTQGATAYTVSYERSFPQAKTLSMLGSYTAYREAKKRSAYDALLLDRDGHILEGTRTNFFVLKEKTIIGAPKEKILEGVTMRHMLSAAKDAGFSYDERFIKITDLKSVDGAFLTSTSSGIMPLKAIDDVKIPVSPELRELMKAFDASEATTTAA